MKEREVGWVGGCCGGLCTWVYVEVLWKCLGKSEWGGLVGEEEEKKVENAYRGSPLYDCGTAEHSTR